MNSSSKNLASTTVTEIQNATANGLGIFNEANLSSRLDRYPCQFDRYWLADSSDAFHWRSERSQDVHSREIVRRLKWYSWNDVTFDTEVTTYGIRFTPSMLKVYTKATTEIDSPFSPRSFLNFNLRYYFRKSAERTLLDSWRHYLYENQSELISKYSGKYVAIWENQVYDSNKDLAALAKRVYSKLGYRPVFMPYIADKEQVYKFVSL